MIHLIGNLTRDHIVNGPKRVKAFGGSVLYAGLFLARSGYEVTIIGKGDDNDDTILAEVQHSNLEWEQYEANANTLRR